MTLLAAVEARRGWIRTVDGHGGIINTMARVPSRPPGRGSATCDNHVVEHNGLHRVALRANDDTWAFLGIVDRDIAQSDVAPRD